MRSLLRFLAGRSPAFVAATSLLLVAVLGLIDWITGPEVRFFIFYWPPIAVGAWFIGQRWGYMLVGAATAAWLTANAGYYEGSGNVLILVWNASVNLVSFALLAWLIARLRDLLERERLTARTDFLTGVANSRAFSEALDQAIARAQRHDLALALGYVDVDDFKTINDRLGHSTGDQVLRSVAQAIRAVLRASDSVGRLGGDEFGVLLPDTDADAAEAVLQRLRRDLAALAAQQGWPLSVSIGAVVCRPTECDVDQLIRRADALMYEVKATGKDNVRVVVDERASVEP
jgi:diguanylate cyclase (GGDEF)-like protein